MKKASKKKVAIIGAGISGLSLAWFLQKAKPDAFDIAFFEKHNKVGGYLQTFREKDFLFEMGPRGFRPVGKGLITYALALELGLQKEICFADKKSKNRFIYKDGKLNKFSFPYLLQNGFITGCFKDLISACTSKEDETIADFCRRRFNEKLLMAVMDPLSKGIYGGDPEMLSMKSCFPLLWKMEKEHRSLLKGLFFGKKNEKKPIASLLSFKNGMHSFVEALYYSLDAQFFMSEPALKITINNTFKIITSRREYEADFLVTAVADSEIYTLLGLSPIVAERVTLSTVNMGWDGKQLPFKGYGFLVPSSERKELLGMTFDSEIFPDQSTHEHTRITAMIRGGGAKKEMLQKALKEVATILNIHAAPACTHVTSHEKAIPQYTVGYEERLKKYFEAFPKNAYFLGNSFGGVSVNDCIDNARRLAERLIDNFSR